jgi:hypothetical protein
MLDFAASTLNERRGTWRLALSTRHVLDEQEAEISSFG